MLILYLFTQSNTVVDFLELDHAGRVSERENLHLGCLDSDRAWSVWRFGGIEHVADEAVQQLVVWAAGLGERVDVGAAEFTDVCYSF